MYIALLASREGHDDLVNLLVLRGEKHIPRHRERVRCSSGADVNRTTEDTQETARMY